MMFLITNERKASYDKDIWKLLFEADQEFIPALSARNQTTQKNLTGGVASLEGPVAYFTQMLEQHFVLAIEEGRVIGFLSFIPDHSLTVGECTILCDYVSTIVVSPEMRNRGITRKMYQTLFAHRPGRRIATRTWSTNTTHLHLLGTLGFSLIHRIENDRGEGLDTVYYLRESAQDEG